jgi:hypothetical protein
VIAACDAAKIPYPKDPDLTRLIKLHGSITRSSRMWGPRAQDITPVLRGPVTVRSGWPSSIRPTGRVGSTCAPPWAGAAMERFGVGSRGSLSHPSGAWAIEQS